MTVTIPRSTGNTPSTQSEDSNPPSRESSKEGDTAAYLEGLCIKGVLAVNDRDLAYSKGGLNKAISSTYRSHHENFPHPLTLAEHGAIMQQTVEKFPEYHVGVRSISSDIDEQTGIATVYMEVGITGAPPGTRMALMNEFRWRRDGDTWRCWLHHGMKGMIDFN